MEDDEVFALVARRMLAAEFDMDEVTTLREARGRLRDRGAGRAIDLVLLDLALPDSSGEDSVREILHRAPGTPIVVLTGGDRLPPTRALEMGAADFVSKIDLDAESLSRAVRFALARRSAEEVRRKVEQRDRLAMVGRFAAGAAHQINNPLTWILGSLELIEADLEHSRPFDLDRLRQLVGEALDGTERIRTIVGDLHDLAAPPTGSRTVVTVSGVVEKAVRLLRQRDERRCRIDVGDLDGLRTRVHENRLLQVVTHLLVNALDAMRELESGRIDVRGRIEGERIVLLVRDEGRGMDPETIERAFEPFFSSRARTGASGLGLSVSSEIVRSYGGAISIRSSPGEGTEVEVRLPRWSEVEEGGGTRPLGAGFSKVRSSVARILVVDDEPSVRTVLSQMLAADFEVIEAPDAERALDIASELALDGILCDLSMPGLGGAGLHGRLPAELRDRVVFLSGGTVDDATRDFVLTADRPLLAKPISREKLVRALRDVVGPQRG